MSNRGLRALASMEGDITPLEQRREDAITLHGPRVAAWLIRDLRKNPTSKQCFREHGAVDYEIARKDLKKLPVWFTIAIDTLRRSNKWTVTILNHATKRVYRIQRL